MKTNRRFFGYAEAVFDSAYLIIALSAGVYILSKGADTLNLLAGGMALILAAGDAFHLVPRVGAVLTGDGFRFQKALGFGKLITSVTMTVFYVLLWHVGLFLFPPLPKVWTVLFYMLAALRIILCISPQNGWTSQNPPLKWAVLRNIPFALIGIAAAVFFAVNRGVVLPLFWMWLAVALSFAFYLPVVIWAGKHPPIGMLMLPKTCMYLWMLYMLLSI